MILTTFLYEGIALKRLGAGEACWAHNPKVLGSKPRAATTLIFFFFYRWKDGVKVFFKETNDNRSFLTIV